MRMCPPQQPRGPGDYTRSPGFVCFGTRAESPPWHSEHRPKEAPDDVNVTSPRCPGSERITLAGPVVEMHDGHTAVVLPKVSAQTQGCSPAHPSVFCGHTRSVFRHLHKLCLTCRKWEWKEPRLEAQGSNVPKTFEKSPQCVLDGLGGSDSLLTLTASSGCSEPGAQAFLLTLETAGTTSQI